MSVKDIADGISNTRSGSDGTNYILLMDILREVGQFASLILGLLIVAIYIVTPLIIAFEIMYINIGVIRPAVDKCIEHDGKPARCLKLMCRDAREAVEMSVLNDRNANYYYAIIKCKSLTMIGLVFSIAIDGVSILIGVADGVSGSALRTILSLF